MRSPHVKRDEQGLIVFEYPVGYRGPYAANPLAETDADVLDRVIAEMRAHFDFEDPETNLGFAAFLRDLDRLEALARSLRNTIDIGALGRGVRVTAAA